MIDMDFERTMSIEPSDYYEAISLSYQIAEANGGFACSYVVNRTLIIMLAIALAKHNGDGKKSDEIRDMIASDLGVLGTWKALVADGTVDKILKDDKDLVSHLLEDASVYGDERERYRNGLASAAESVSDVIDTFANAISSKLQDIVSSEQYQKAMEIARKYGYEDGQKPSE